MRNKLLKETLACSRRNPVSAGSTHEIHKLQNCLKNHCDRTMRHQEIGPLGRPGLVKSRAIFRLHRFANRYAGDSFFLDEDSIFLRRKTSVSPNVAC